MPLAWPAPPPVSGFDDEVRSFLPLLPHAARNVPVRSAAQAAAVIRWQPWNSRWLLQSGYLRAVPVPDAECVKCPPAIQSTGSTDSQPMPITDGYRLGRPRAAVA